MTREADQRHMAAALTLARRGLGNVWPNPAVGCVLVAPGGQVIGRGWTQPGGRPHAEAEALARAGTAAYGTTAYVTLEPCSHAGRGPACAGLLVEAGIARAVIAIGDPDPRVDGGGIARLREAGIAVEEGVLAAEAASLNAGFILRVREGRPLVTLKLATSLDGRIAAHGGDSRWVTGSEARAAGHALRAGHDAVAVGIGTALADDPMLTCRLPGLEDRRPVRIVFDSRLRLPLTAALVRTAAAHPVWLVTRPDGGEPARRAVLRDCGVTLIEVEPDETGAPDITAALRALGARGLTRLLVEGGSHLAAALLRAGAVDRVEWFRSATVIGGDGVPAVQPLGVDRVADAPRFRTLETRPLGPDLWQRLGREE